jgi:hypothetical protein
MHDGFSTSQILHTKRPRKTYEHVIYFLLKLLGWGGAWTENKNQFVVYFARFFPSAVFRHVRNKNGYHANTYWI